MREEKKMEERKIETGVTVFGRKNRRQSILPFRSVSFLKKGFLWRWRDEAKENGEASLMTYPPEATPTRRSAWTKVWENEKRSECGSGARKWRQENCFELDSSVSWVLR